jgi:hypothetical protein
MSIKLTIGSCICWVFALIACQPNATNTYKKNFEADGKMLAELQCQAKRLQDERFALANAIRFLEDSVALSAANPGLRTAYQSRLDSLNGTTEDVWRRTKVMADSIMNTLQRLHGSAYQSKTDRKLLDEAMDAAYQAYCRE